MPARLFLHLSLAAVSQAPLLMLMLVFNSPLQGEWYEFALLGAALLAGQLAALFAWRPIRESGTAAALFHGFVMGVVMHALFGPVLMAMNLGQRIAGEHPLYMMVLASVYSLYVAWLTLPLCVVIAVLVNRLHRRQLQADHAAAPMPRRW